MNKTIIIVAAGLMFAGNVLADGLRETVGKHFLIGTAMNAVQVRSNDPAIDEIVDKHFNAVVAENCMKAEELQPNEGLFDYRQADRLVEYAQKHNMTLTGHCLIWHSQVPRWFFKDELGNPCTREVLIGRIQDHIKTVMAHFKGKVKGWDVVNEAILDDGSYRQSQFYKIIGPEFIEIAFRAAMEGDPDAELYLNDFSMSNKGKRDKYCEIIRDFKDGRINLLFANPKMVGKGLTFTNCTYCVYYSLSYSYEDFKQSQDRIHRIGQGSKCTYIVLQAQDTIEERIYSCLQRKGNAVDELYLEMGAKTNGNH